MSSQYSTETSLSTLRSGEELYPGPPAAAGVGDEATPRVVGDRRGGDHASFCGPREGEREREALTRRVGNPGVGRCGGKEAALTRRRRRAATPGSEMRSRAREETRDDERERRGA
jgi:hypothetical protein